MAATKKKTISRKTTARKPAGRTTAAKRMTSRKPAKRASSARRTKQEKLTFTKGQDYIMEAITNVKKELMKLDDQRDNLNRKVRSVESAMNRARLEETRLRDELSKIVAREGLIGSRAKKLKAKLIDVKNRIVKVSDIKETLSNGK